jgi:hypothetical protein
MAKASLIDAPADAPTIEVWNGATLAGQLAQENEKS